MASVVSHHQSLNYKHFHLSFHTLASSCLSSMWHSISDLSPLLRPHWSTDCSQFWAPTLPPLPIMSLCLRWLPTPLSNTIISRCQWVKPPDYSNSHSLYFEFLDVSNILIQALIWDSIIVTEAGILCKFNKHLLSRLWRWRDKVLALIELMFY